MEHSSALNKILESADLIRMLEELTNPASFQRVAGSSLSGIRITLKNVRESLLSSHDALAANYVNNAKVAYEAQNDVAPTQIIETKIALPTELTQITPKSDIINSARSPIVSDSQRMQMTRRDLRASLEKMVER